jgi:DNA-directed RNA polymerase subunit alpha
MIEHALSIKCVTTTTDHDGSIYGKFVIEPLERGFGTTLGNALRRVLLSIIPGVAITSVRLQNANHEFTNIDGVVEDVMDILLNLKGVVLKAEVEGPHVVRVDVKRPGLVTAGDLELPAGLKVVNPSWPICTLSEGGHLEGEFTVEEGKGYVAAEQLLAASRNVDTLSIDACFMPIRRVAYTVNDTRVGQRTDYDSLVLEIWSNGSVEVSHALSLAANSIIEHLVPIASLSGIPTLVNLPAAEVEEPLSDAPSITIGDLELSVRAFNCLKRANIHNIQDLLLKCEVDLLNIKNFGKKSSDEVIERLATFNLFLKPNPEGALVEVE